MTRLTITCYSGIAVFVAISNIATTSTVTPFQSAAMTGVNIPPAYLASLPDVLNNAGQVPAHVKAATVVPNVIETHRGWPQRVQSSYGYRYDLVNVSTGYSARLSGYPNHSGVNWPKLLLNFAGIFAVAAVLHFSVLLYFRRARFTSSAPLQSQPGGG